VTGQISDAERAALPIAKAAIEGRASSYGLADSVVFALSAAGMLRLLPATSTGTPMPEHQLAEIEARAAAAFDGPWYLVTVRDDDDCGDTVVGVATAADTFIISAQEPSEVGAEDGTFIAHSREDVPALVAEIRRLLGERDAFADRVDTLTAVAKGNKRHVASLLTSLIATEKHVAELEPENERLHTWPGLMSVLDEHYPPDAVIGDTDQRIAVLVRVVDQARARVAALEAERHSTNEVLSDAAEVIRAKETAAGLVAEYRVPTTNGKWLSVRREPNGDRWAIIASHRADGDRRAWVDGRWQAMPVVSRNGLWTYPGADAALAEATRIAMGGERP